MNSLSVIIVTYQSSNVLPRLLDSLERQDVPAEEYDLIVVDNDSSDASAGIIEGRFPQARLIKNAENRGFAAAANQGAQLATGKYLLFLNPDTVLEEDFLRSSIRFLDANPDVGVFGPQLVSLNGEAQSDCWRSPSWPVLLAEVFLPYRLALPLVTSRPGGTTSVQGVSGACMMTGREVFVKVGGFDERFFMYYEDLDYCRRVEAGGYRVMHLHDLVTVHLGASSSHKDLDTFFTTSYRSKLAYYQKTLSLPSLAGTLIRVGLSLRIASYSLLGLFLPRFSNLAQAHRLAWKAISI